MLLGLTHIRFFGVIKLCRQHQKRSHYQRFATTMQECLEMYAHLRDETPFLGTKAFT
jgi:hypothetical protein